MTFDELRLEVLESRLFSILQLYILPLKHIFSYPTSTLIPDFHTSLLPRFQIFQIFILHFYLGSRFSRFSSSTSTSVPDFHTPLLPWVLIFQIFILHFYQSSRFSYTTSTSDPDFILNLHLGSRFSYFPPTLVPDYSDFPNPLLPLVQILYFILYI